MLQDGLQLVEGSTIDNLTIESGDATAQGLENPTTGSMFFRSDTEELQIHNGTTWAAIGGGGGGSITGITSTADAETINIDANENVKFNGGAPEDWLVGRSAVEFGGHGVMWNYTTPSGAPNLNLGANYYLNATGQYIMKNTGTAADLALSGNGLTVRVSNNGTAGGIIGWQNRLIIASNESVFNANLSLQNGYVRTNGITTLAQQSSSSDFFSWNVVNRPVTELTLNGNVEVDFFITGLTGGGAKETIEVTLIVIQGGLGSYNLTFEPTPTIYWAGGSAPTFNTALGTRHIVKLVSYDFGSSWYETTRSMNLA